MSTLLGGLGVNIFDVEIAHSVEGDRGVLVLIVDAGAEDVVRKALTERGYKASVQKARTMSGRNCARASGARGARRRN